MKWFKRILLGLLIFFILLTTAVFSLIAIYKGDMAEMLRENLKVNYGLDLKVGDVKVSFFSNWPRASVELKEIRLSSTINAAGHTEMVKAGSLSLSFNLRKLLQREFIVQSISLKDAEVNLIKYEDGTKNFEFKKPKADTLSEGSGIKFEVSIVTIKNTLFHFINAEKAQNIGINFKDNKISVKNYLDGIEAEFSGKTLVEGLMFNAEKGEFLKNTRCIFKLNFSYFKNSKSICFHPPSNVEIEGHSYQLTSLIDLTENKKLALIIESKGIKAERAAALLTPKIRKALSNFEVKRPLDAKVLVLINLGKKEEPILLAEITGRHCDLSIGKSKIPYSDLNFVGKITSLHQSRTKGDMEHGKIVFTPIKGNVYDFPFTANVTVSDLIHPQITIDAGLFIEASKIKFKLAQDFALKGTANALISYSGPADYLNKEDFLGNEMHLKAEVIFNNLSYRELEQRTTYLVNGKALVTNKDLNFDKLKLISNLGKADLTGRALNFIPYVLGFTNKLKAEVNANTEQLDLNPLLVREEKTGKADKKQNSSAKLAHSDLELGITIFAKSLLVRKVSAQQAKLNFVYKNNSIEVKSLSMNTCEGQLQARAMITDLKYISGEASVNNVNVSSLFKDFENFGQEAIGSENLKGTMYVDTKFKFELDQDRQIKGESMTGEVKLKLKDGHLINFEPLQNLSNFLFRNRDLNDIVFSELNEKFKVRGYELEIEELEIGSNVLNLYVVNGIYSIKGNSSINILVPWSNLKRRGKNYVPKNTGESAENTKGVKLNFFGENKKMKISFGHKEIRHL